MVLHNWRHIIIWHVMISFGKKKIEDISWLSYILREVWSIQHSVSCYSSEFVSLNVFFFNNKLSNTLKKYYIGLVLCYLVKIDVALTF